MLQRPQHSVLELQDSPVLLQVDPGFDEPPPLPGPHFSTPWLLFKSFAEVSHEHVSRLAG
jgi:hypothetical protein